MDKSHETPTITDPVAPEVGVAPRSLLVVAGLPGAGKSTVLRKLHGGVEVRALDSEQVRAKLRSALPERTPYRWYRAMVHLVHRARIAWHCAVTRGPVVAHEPATRGTTRAMLVLLAWLTARRRVLVWLHVDPDTALAGQLARGRLIRKGSFHRHARRSVRIHGLLASGGTLRGWHRIHLFHRADLEHGLAVRLRE